MTQRAFLVGTIGLCFYFISVTNGLPPSFSVLTWLALSLLVASGAVALLSLQGLKCRFRITRASGAAAWPASTRDANSDEETQNQTANTKAENAGNERAPELEVHLDNGGTLNKTGLVLAVKLRAQNSSRETVRRFVVEALPSNKNLTAILPLENLPRGLYQIEEIRITGSDVLGLFRVTARYNAQSYGEGTLRIAVAPAHLKASAASTRGGEEGARRGVRGGGDELRGTRPFVAGDDLRAVHWKTTARLGHLVVREFDATSRRRAFILWDGAAASRREAASKREYSHRETTASGAENEAVEQSLRLAMSLCAALSRRNHDCVLLRLNAAPQRVSSDAAAFSARCGEVLAAAAPNRTTPLSAESAPLVSRGGVRGDAFFVVTHRADETLVGLCRAWRAQNAEVCIALVESDELPRASTRARGLKNARRQGERATNAAFASTRDDENDAVRRDESTENGALLFGETMREFATTIQTAGARVALVEARGERRESIENAMHVLLGGAARASQNGGATSAANAFELRDSAFGNHAKTVEQNVRREAIS